MVEDTTRTRPGSGAPSRRERNKQAKLDRIVAAAGELFAAHGIDDVTTQQIADAADIGTGTLFLYARTKNELLLLVQNAKYGAALAEGTADAADATTAADAVMAVLTPIVRCNRAQPDNGRVYLREIAFGDAAQPHHSEAAAIVADTGVAVAQTLTRTAGMDQETATETARLALGAMMMALAGAGDAPDEEILGRVRRSIEVLVRE